MSPHKIFVFFAIFALSVLVTSATEQKETAAQNNENTQQGGVNEHDSVVGDETVINEKDKSDEIRKNEEKRNTYSEADAPVIEITDGKVRGTIMKSRKGKTIYGYLGIPYAKPPVGDLRFKNPQRVDKWEGVRDATRDRNMCPQNKYPTREYDGNEDCLYLNVYTTRLPVNDSVVGKIVWDVVVLIHGGGFTFGSGHLDDYSPEHLLDVDIVLVTFNYRLGAFGFLSTGDEAAPGNFGLKDQVDALRWVKRNIESFSGNPNSVSILGHHAGAAAAHLHLLSPLSQDLFHGVISISGTALSPWAHVPREEARRRAFKMGELVGCKDKTQDTQKLIKCLKRKPAQEIVKKIPHVTEWLHDLHYPFVPVTEPNVQGKKSFMAKDPVEMIMDLKDRKQTISWIIGVAAHEGLPQALQTMVFRGTMVKLNENPAKTLPHYLEMSISPPSKAEEISQKAWNFYLKNQTLDYGNLNRLEELTSDYNYLFGVAKSVELHSEVSKSAVLVYRFSFHIRDERFTLGVPQGDDIGYLFPDTIAGHKIEYEKEIFPTVERLVRIVENFAREGDPTPKEEEILNNVLWPTAEGKKFEFIDIGHVIKVIKDGFYPERMEFWEKIYGEHKLDHRIKDEL